jgi:hypothetical protein
LHGRAGIRHIDDVQVEESFGGAVRSINDSAAIAALNEIHDVTVHRKRRIKLRRDTGICEVHAVQLVAMIDVLIGDIRDVLAVGAQRVVEYVTASDEGPIDLDGCARGRGLHHVKLIDTRRRLVGDIDDRRDAGGRCRIRAARPCSGSRPAAIGTTAWCNARTAA